ncbi:hypothetical protein BDZ85DRAFT_242652 [Elsinoe ampelina]|uniref:Uncharacterized protein n=1 Tax=Elsinoe ampelina TaxID=302913 RepID=A0A6A6G2R4_9PEZI|nr:hypothetical protein BDZ85DRAFT_242652 [Elsinoe ampelina]
MLPEEEESNYAIFRDCLSDLITTRLAPVKERRRVKGRKNEIKPAANPSPDENPAEDLADFIDYLATEIFLSLPVPLRTLSYKTLQSTPSLAAQYSVPLPLPLLESLTSPLPPSVPDTFTTFHLLPPTHDLPLLLSPVFEAYVTSASAPPPEHVYSVRATECEVCGRGHLPLTYHHLIPRQVQAKAVKRGWVGAWEVQKVAWLCRACHGFVHRVATNEELAREWNSVEKLGEREDVQAWAGWVGRVRWKKR